MRDCKLVMTVVNDIVDFIGEDISIEELAMLAGFLQVFVGQQGLSRGLSLDDVKDNMLDIHLASMETVEEQVRSGRIQVHDTS